jgi:hypothetical protein
MMQFLWTELVDPPFDEYTKLAYTEMANSYGQWAQVYPVGNIVGGRRMFHGIGSVNLAKAVMEFINNRGKDAKLITVKDKAGIDYGYKRVLITPEDGENDPVYEIVRDEEITDLFEIDRDNVDTYLQSRIEIVDGEEVTIIPSPNSFAGWASII